MEIEKIYTELVKQIDKEKIFVNEPMKKHTSFKIGGNADIFVKAQTLDDIKYIIEFTRNNNIPLSIVGNGSNLLVKDDGIRGIVLKPDIQTIEIQENNNEIFVSVGAGYPVPKLAIEMAKRGYSGLEFAAGIPGTIGGAVRMNAGAYGGEMKDIIVNTTYIDIDGKINTISNENQKFGYRTSIFANEKYIVLGTKIKLNKGNIEEIQEKINDNMKSRIEKQPIDMPTAGSTFKRKEGIITAKLIDEAGLKGYSIGDAEVSTKHAGFIVNKGNATAEDVLKLIKHIQDTIYEKYNEKIELEIEVMGE